MNFEKKSFIKIFQMVSCFQMPYILKVVVRAVTLILGMFIYIYSWPWFLLDFFFSPIFYKVRIFFLILKLKKLPAIPNAYYISYSKYFKVIFVSYKSISVILAKSSKRLLTQIKTRLDFFLICRIILEKKR